MFRKWICAIALLLASAAALAAGKVNINTASAETLANELDGVGPNRAAAIIEYRELHGDFPSVGALLNVSGIGEVTIESNRDRLTVGDPE
ncbi:MAG: ComEA family DNA-binding protein [Candidatus Competibacterales bacterium]|nr:ComEA family DNA-binding protein [Candidatus Competibacterales bacterium]